MKTLPRLFLALILLSVLACGGSGSSSNSGGSRPRPQNTGDALVRLINASPASGALDLLIRGKSVAENIGYLEDSGYENINSGNASFTVRDTGAFTTIEDSTRSFTLKKQYSIFAFGSQGDRKVQIVEDDNDEPRSGRVRVRFVNAEFISKGVDVYIVAPGDDIQFTEPAYPNVGKEKVTDYLESDEGTFVVRVTEKDQKDIIAESEILNLQSGTIRTLVFATNLNGASDHDIAVLTDRE